MLNQTLLIHVLLFDSETMMWREKEKSGTWALQKDTVRDLVNIMRMEKECQIHRLKLCGVMKGVDERIDKRISDGLDILKEWG